MREGDFLAQVIAFARLHRWRCAHFRPGLNRRGKWQTAVQGDGVGFPDLLLIRGEEIIVAELKVGKRQLTLAQMAWMRWFEGAHVSAYTWRPDCWEEIEGVLT